MRHAASFCVLSLFILGLGVSIVPAEEITVSAQVNQTRIREAHVLQLSVVVSGTAAGQAPPPDTSGLTDFEIVAGPSVSSSFRWINGRTASSKSYTYRLRPRKTGLLTIPALGVLLKGKTYRTRPIEVTVLPGGGTPRQGGRQLGPRTPPRRPGEPGGARAGGAAEVQLRSTVDKRSVYVGEQLTVSFLLATQTEVLNLQLADNPTFPGFWTEDIKLPENLDMRRVQIGGHAFNEYTLLKKVLFPTTAGRLTIPAVRYRIQVRRRTRDAFESFFFTPTETLVRQSSPIEIDVRPLPEQGRPDDFSGAVGRFNLSVKADRQEAQVSDAIGLQIKISGDGNLNVVDAPQLAELSDFKKYEPKVEQSAGMRDDRFRSEKTWDYVVIPLAPGAQQIPAISLSYFDPDENAYRRVTSSAIPIQVARGEGSIGMLLPPVAQSDVKRLRSDIHYIKPAPDGLSDRSGVFYRSPLFATLILIPLIADVGIVVAVRLRAPSQARSRQRRERRARTVARRRFKDARRLMTPSTGRAFYAAVAQALTEYVGDKFDAAGAGLTHQRIEELLAQHGATDSVRVAYHRCLEGCDFARFAPTRSDTNAMQKAVDRAEQTLVELERSLNT